MILVLTGPEDTTADRVVDKLAQRGAPLLRMNPEDFPIGASLSFESDARGRAGRQLRLGPALHDLGAVGAVWLRRPRPPRAHADIEREDWSEYAAAECRHFADSLFDSLDAFWLPGPLALERRASQKTRQLALATRIGFEIPPTLITNDPARLRRFHREHGGRIVSKLASNALPLSPLGRQLSRHTERVSRRSLAAAASLRYAPAIFQAYVDKQVELRVTVVGEKIFAAEIHSQESGRTRDDWRRYDFAHTPHAVHVLPDEIGRRCLTLLEVLGLSYGAIDLILTPDGRYVFLEINPNGQYHWIEELTGLPISDAICELLIRHGGDR